MDHKQFYKKYLNLGLSGKEKSAKWYDEDNLKNIGMFNDNIKHKFVSETIKKFKKSGNVLEMGCNDARLATYLDGFKFYGQDISPRIVERAKIKCEAKVGDAYLPKWLDIMFDVIVSSDLIEHLERPFDHIKACFDSLKDNGIFVLLTPNALSARKLALLSNLDRIPPEPENHINMMTYWRLIRLLSNVGFKRLTWVGVKPEIDDMLMVVCEKNDKRKDRTANSDK